MCVSHPKVRRLKTVLIKFINLILHLTSKSNLFMSYSARVFSAHTPERGPGLFTGREESLI